jgi:hypothetical protein
MQFAAIILVRADKITDKVCRNAIAWKREGMSTEQLLHMSAVRTDSFNSTGFDTYNTIQYNRVQYSTVQYSAVQYSTIK